MKRLALALVLVGCNVGSGNIGGPPGDDDPGGSDMTPDAGAGDDPDASSPIMPDAAVFMCRDRVDVATLSNGHHNAGQDCMSGCHNHGFTLSGTLYNAATGGTIVKGGSITVVDANGQTFDMQSQLNGNFYTVKPVTFPVKVTASLCPDIKPMIANVTSGNGGCNKTGCHTAAGAGRVHIP